MQAPQGPEGSDVPGLDNVQTAAQCDGGKSHPKHLEAGEQCHTCHPPKASQKHHDRGCRAWHALYTLDDCPTEPSEASHGCCLHCAEDRPVREVDRDDALTTSTQLAEAYN